MNDSERHLFRHILATLAYRTAKTMRDAPPEFANLKLDPTSNTPVQIVAHMGDLIEASHRAARGNAVWKAQAPQEWEAECARFFDALQAFDDFLASGASIECNHLRFLQGPILDAFTHTGQLAMLRRLAGVPMKGEGYDVADIVVGRVGFDQTPPDPDNEFD